MRGRGRASDDEFPSFPIGPVLEHFGFTNLPPEGTGWRGIRCAFHPDSDASGSVNMAEGIYNCHAADCPKGNAVQVLMQWEGLNYREAVSRAEQITGQVGARTSPPDRRRGGSRGGRGGTRESARVWRRPGR